MARNNKTAAAAAKPKTVQMSAAHKIAQGLFASQKTLDEVHITANKNAIPNDPEKPFVTSGIRVGTPAVTSRGFGKEEMRLIAKWIKAVATDFEAQKDRVSAEVQALCEKFPIYR